MTPEPSFLRDLSASQRFILLALAIVVSGAVIGLIAFLALGGRTSGQPAAAELPSATSAGTGIGTAPPPPPQAPLFAASSIDTVLLSSKELNDLLGTYTLRYSGRGPDPMMELVQSIYGMSDHSRLVTPEACVGVIFGAEHRVWADSGFDEMRDQTFRPYFYRHDETISPPWVVEQTVAVFPTVNSANAVLASSQDQWQSCANSGVTETVPPEDSRQFGLGPVNRTADLLTISMASNGPKGGAFACQQALGVRENVVVGTRSCIVVEETYETEMNSAGWPTNPDWATNDAERLARAMLDKVEF